MPAQLVGAPCKNFEVKYSVLICHLCLPFDRFDKWNLKGLVFLKVFKYFLLFNSLCSNGSDKLNCFEGFFKPGTSTTF